MNSSEIYDVLVIGAGPGGSAAAIRLAKAGYSVLVVDRQTFPRFRIGESLLPHTQGVLRDLGVLEKVKAQPHVIKRGLEIGFGSSNREPATISFDEIMGDSEKLTFNIRGECLDQALADGALEAGAEIRFGEGVKSIDQLETGDVRVTLASGEVRARCLVDASGQASVVGRHLGRRKMLSSFKNICYFEHFTGVDRPSGDHEGFASVVMCREVWFWMIPLDEETTSVGVVIENPLAKEIPVPGNQRLQWCIDNCPAMKERMKDAVGPDRNRVIGDFSYTCDPYAGPGYFLVGDAAAFIDPVWSTGVSLGLAGGVHAADQIIEMFAGRTTPTRAEKSHQDWISSHRKIFLGLISKFYDHSFRELLVAGKGPLGVHRAVVTLLAGEVFGGMPWSVRWRWELLQWFTSINRYHALNQRIRPHSMLLSGGVPLPTPDAGVIGDWHRRALRRKSGAWQST